ncbi:uncharacterized protein LOC129293060 [Prosopis cineraria]|uniref:uncharacterized protein LOC129293060 n=1 Tax=Prosopis cineraria TaxID=364024 RepID=UPI00240FBE20|nr:uncharacterized protein LOC129293060 [Prosopis cineraria]
MAASVLNKKSHNHVRSNSLPSKPHPLILQCHEHFSHFGATDATLSSSLLSLKLNNLQDLHDSIEKLVQLPLTQEALVREHQEKWVDELLDGSLRVLDACTSAKDALLHTKECTRELQSIIRRRRGGNDVELATEVKKFLTSRKVVRKAIFKALESLKGVAANKCCRLDTNKDHQTMTLVSLLKEGEVVTLSTFESLLNFISGSTQSKPSRWSLVSKLMHSKRVVSAQGVEDENEFEKVDSALQFFVFNMTSKSNNINDLQNKLEKLESCIQDLEEGLEFLFRRLIKIRVAFLNILNYYLPSAEQSLMQASCFVFYAPIANGSAGPCKRMQRQVCDELLDISLRILDICSSVGDFLIQSKAGKHELHSTIRRSRVADNGITIEGENYLASRKKMKKAIQKAFVNVKRTKNICSSTIENEELVLLRMLKEAEVVTVRTLESLLHFISHPKGRSKQSRWGTISKLIQQKRVVCDSQESITNEFVEVDAALKSLISHKSTSTDNFQCNLENLEICIHDLEIGVENLSRQLIRNRVSLLNIFNH